MGSIVPGADYKPPAPVAAPVTPAAAPTGQTDAQIQAAKAAAGYTYNNQGQYVPPAPTSTTTPSAGTTGTTSTSSTTTGQNASDPLQVYREKQLAQSEQALADAKVFNQKQDDILNGVIPLSAGQNAQIEGLKKQFQDIIDKQIVMNTAAEGTGQIRGYQTGAAEYDPTFQAKVIGSIASAGASKVLGYQTEMASAVAALTESFKNNNLAASKDAYDRLQEAQEKYNAGLEKYVKDTQDAIDKAAKAQIDAEKTTYERVTKPIQDIGVEAAKNGATSAIRAKIAAAQTVQEALDAAGDSLMTATGDLGAYLFSKRQTEAKGAVAPDWETWSKNLEQEKLNSKIAELRATEGIKFSYAVALENAKEELKKAGTKPINYNGEFAATIKLAAQAGSTNAQRDQIKTDLEGFIADGDYDSAYTQILSSASAKLTGANASNFQQVQQNHEALKDMRDALKEYQALGGSTNIFKGGADKIQTKIGALATDPKYAAVSVRLNSAFQQYRQNMTGAAFGPAESSEYQSVLPSAGNTFALNMAKIEGAEAYTNSVLEGTIKNTIGQGGIYIKQYAEADQKTLIQQVDKEAKLTEFRKDPKNNDMVIELKNAGLNMDQIMEELNIK